MSSEKEPHANRQPSLQPAKKATQDLALNEEKNMDSKTDLNQDSAPDRDNEEKIQIVEEGQQQAQQSSSETNEEKMAIIDAQDMDKDETKHTNELDNEPANEEKQYASDGLQPDEELSTMRPKSKRKRKSNKSHEVQKPVKIIHMVFDQAGGEQIKQSFEIEPANAGEIIYIEDNYSLGPVADLSEAEGWQARKNWWQSVLELPEDTQPEVMRADKMKIHQLFQQLEEDEDTVLWIWMGQNERDVSGYYYIISYLMAFQGRIHVLYLNNLPFIDEKGHIFYPKQLSEIRPKEYVKAARLARVVTLSEFELDPEEWDKLSRSPGSVRLLEGGKKLSVRENDYYDKIILDQLGSATMKLAKLLGLLVTKSRLSLPEYYIIWRIKSLIETGQIISQGDFEKGAKNVSLKATQGQLFVELNPEESEEVDGA